MTAGALRAADGSQRAEASRDGAPGVGVLRRQDRMTMLALDQRGSLRTMLARDRPVPQVPDAELISFKAQAVAALASDASAVLLDSTYGRDAMAALPGDTPLILAADQFRQQPGGPVDQSGFDEMVTPELVRELNPVAVKMLIIWRAADDPGYRAEQVTRFMALARQTGRIALLEAITRPAAGDRFATAAAHGAAVIAAARELTASQPDVYKAEVPAYLPGQLELVEEYSRRLSEQIAQPWVVLSNGVRAEDFADGVRRAVTGGASGFLAGRAIWEDAARSGNPAEALRSISVPRLRALADVARQSGPEK
jgi:sulfofructosephosphate aldolase